MPLTLIGTAGLAFGERAALPLDAAEWLTARLLEWLDVLAAHAPPAVAAGVPGWAVALSVLAALLLVLPRGTGLRWLSLPLLLPLAPLSTRIPVVLAPLKMILPLLVSRARLRAR